MSTGSESAEQMVRSSVEVSAEVAKLALLGAKNLAALLFALIMEHEQNPNSRGKTGIEKLIRQGKPLSVFSIMEKDLKLFQNLCRQYGVMYTPVLYKQPGQEEAQEAKGREPSAPEAVEPQEKNATEPQASTEQTAPTQDDAKAPELPAKQEAATPARVDNLCDILVKAEDIARINRILEHMGYAAPSLEADEKNAVTRTAPENELSVRGDGYDRRKLPQTDLRELLDSPEKLLTDPEQLRAYCEMRGRVHDYSPKNTERIIEQCPDAQLVLSRSEWRALGREVTPNPREITIYSPGMEDGEMDFTLVPVYDIRDTVQVERAHHEPASPEDLRAGIDSLTKACPVPILEEAGAPRQGIFDPEKGAILLPPYMTLEERFHTLALESTLARMHQKGYGGREACLPTAESIALSICARHGVDGSRYDLSKLRDYAASFTPEEARNFLHNMEFFYRETAPKTKRAKTKKRARSVKQALSR